MPSVAEPVALPAGSLVAQLGFTSYSDAYRVALDPERVPDVDAFARMFVKNPPGWIRSLMGARDAVVGIFGLKKSSDAPRSSAAAGPVAIGDFLGFFRVTERSDNEIIAGEDDRHLDFRVSFLYERDEHGCHGTISTVVRFNNGFGRAYFFPVAPVHRLIVPAMLDRTSRGARGGDSSFAPLSGPRAPLA